MNENRIRDIRAIERPSVTITLESTQGFWTGMTEYPSMDLVNFVHSVRPFRDIRLTRGSPRLRSRASAR